MFLLAMLITFAGYSQKVVNRDIEATNSLTLNGYKINSISNDTNFAAHTATSVPTSYATYVYITNSLKNFSTNALDSFDIVQNDTATLFNGYRNGVLVKTQIIPPSNCPISFADLEGSYIDNASLRDALANKEDYIQPQSLLDINRYYRDGLKGLRNFNDDARAALKVVYDSTSKFMTFYDTSNLFLLHGNANNMDSAIFKAGAYRWNVSTRGTKPGSGYGFFILQTTGSNYFHNVSANSAMYGVDGASGFLFSRLFHDGAWDTYNLYPAIKSFTAYQGATFDANGYLISTPKMFLPSAKYATDAALPANTYANGTGGFGATLTASANGALVINANTPNVGDNVLVKNESDRTHNGLYTVTVVGDGSTAWVLTRETYSSIGANAKAGSLVYVVSGTEGGRFYVQKTNYSNIVFGASNLDYVSLTANTISFTTPNVIFGSPVNFSNDGKGNWSASLSLNSQLANTFLASPNGSSGTPTFRGIVAADLNGVAILNQTSQQPSSNFNISGAGIIGTTLNVGGKTTGYGFQSKLSSDNSVYFNLDAGNTYAELGTTSHPGVLHLYGNGTAVSPSTGGVGIFNGTSSISFIDANNKWLTLDFSAVSNSTNRNILFRDLSGTVALTSDVKIGDLMKGIQSASTIAASTTQYGWVEGQQATNGTQALRTIGINEAGTLQNAMLFTSGTQSGTGSLVATLYKNGSPTAIVITVPAGSSATSFSDSHTVSVSAGDLLTWQFTNNATATSLTLVNTSITLVR